MIMRSDAAGYPAPWAKASPGFSDAYFTWRLNTPSQLSGGGFRR